MPLPKPELDELGTLRASLSDQSELATSIFAKDGIRGTTSADAKKAIAADAERLRLTKRLGIALQAYRAENQ